VEDLAAKTPPEASGQSLVGRLEAAYVEAVRRSAGEHLVGA
jgi:hypothetical protein